MVRDLGEFGRPDAIINTSKLDYASKLDLTSNYKPNEIDNVKPLLIIAACGGARLEFMFEQSDREKWEKCFEFFKKCVYENGA